MTLADLFALQPAIFSGLVGLLGLLVGSFLNVVIHRLPIMLERSWQAQARDILAADGAPAAGPEPTEVYNLVAPRSGCPGCGAPIKAWQNIPVLSYLLLKGKCAACGIAISPRYPLVEATTAALSVLVAWHFGYSLETLAALILTWALIALTVIDLDHQLLPDSITLPLLWLGIFFSLLGTSFTDLNSAVIGAIAGYLSLWSIFHLFKLVTGKEGMGYGDFKLLGALGAWLGWQMLPVIIILSAAVGAVTGISMILVGGRDSQRPMPFGPFLAAAGFIALLWGAKLTSAYQQAAGF
ncbi:MAG: prepilin peptidase [Gammaproteobacteria bacterium]